MARPRIGTSEELREYAAKPVGAGCRDADIAGMLGISEHNLRNHYCYELRKELAVKRIQVIEALSASTMRDNVTAMETLLEE